MDVQGVQKLLGPEGGVEALRCRRQAPHPSGAGSAVRSVALLRDRFSTSREGSASNFSRPVWSSRRDLDEPEALLT